jgi:spermidine/putrescine transport system permease protein
VTTRFSIPPRVRAALTPYALALPGWLWLVVFFVIPMFFMLSLSLQQGDVIHGFRQTWHFSTYSDALGLFDAQLIRSLLYGLATCLLTLVIAYPMAYWIAFYGGHRKSSYLLLVLLPFFVSFVIRILSWQFLMADNGIVLGTLKDGGLLPQNFHVLATSFAVIAGLTYNFFPFMLLPVYVSLERLDPRLIEAATDLYGNRVQVFLRVILPLSLPGVFAGVLLTFVPASSDFLNASILGGTSQTMIGNIIQTQYFTNNDYPTASALAFTLMAVLVVGIFAYARALGTERVFEGGAR